VWMYLLEVRFHSCYWQFNICYVQTIY